MLFSNNEFPPSLVSVALSINFGSLARRRNGLDTKSRKGRILAKLLRVVEKKSSVDKFDRVQEYIIGSSDWVTYKYSYKLSYCRRVNSVIAVWDSIPTLSASGIGRRDDLDRRVEKVEGNDIVGGEKWYRLDNDNNSCWKKGKLNAGCSHGAGTNKRGLKASIVL